MKATIETLSSPGAMQKIKQGEKELAKGKGKTIEKIKKELNTRNFLNFSMLKKRLCNS